MVDIHALNVLLWGFVIASAFAVGIAAASIMLARLAERGKHLRHVAQGFRALDAHLAEAAKDRAAR